ncbi:putative component of type VI protein secretion system [Azospirillum doebereinerae]
MTLTPPAEFSGSLGLTVTATASVNGTQSSHSEALTVNVAAVADAPSLTVAAASGVEDQAIALTISSALVSPAAGEVLSVVIAGVPAGAVLSAGSDNGDGTWTLTGAQLSGLTLTPPAEFSGSLGLTVTATASVNGTQASHSEALTVSVAAVADAPSLTVATASGSEDQAIALSISSALVSPAAGEVLSVVIAGVPAGAVLSAGRDNGDGTWTLTGAQLSGLTLTPPAEFSGSLGLTVTATATVNGTQASHSEALTVNVAAVADAPVLSVAAASGSEDQAIALTISSALVSPAAGEVLSVVIAGVPAGAVLSAGSDNGDGTWTLTGAQLSGLTLTPPAEFSGSLGLTVTATASVNGTQASHSEALTVNVAAVADAPSLTVAAAYGLEDHAIGLSIAAHLADIDGSESLSLIISGVPAGAVLSAGVNNGNGSWTLTGAQLSGLTLTPPHDFSGTIGLSVTAQATEATGGSATTVLSLPVSVAGVADTPTLAVSAASGVADTAIGLTIAAALQDTDLSETLSVRISGVPAGAQLSHGLLTASAGGFTEWTLSAADLTGLTITPPSHYTGVMDLTVQAISTESDGDSAMSAASHLAVTVGSSSGSGGSSGVTLNLGVVAGVEDTPVALNLLGSLSGLLGSATLDSVIVTGVGNATLSAGVRLPDGSYLLTPAQLAGLTLIPPLDASGDYTLGATVNLGGGQLGTSVSASLDVHVVGVADAPTLSVSGSAGAYASAIPLNIAGALTDTSGTEHLHYMIGVAAGAHLSAGINNGDGTWTVLPSQLAGLTVTPPYGFSGNLPITVTAVSQEVNGDAAYTQQSLTVAVAAPILPTPVSLHGTEDIAIDLGATLLSLNLGTIASIGITELPAGATLSSGGLLNLDAADISVGLLNNLTLHMPAHYSGDFQLKAGIKLLGGLVTLEYPLTGHIDPVADQPTLTVGGTISGTEDQPIPLGISGSLVDLDGSETLSFTVAGLPEGARLSAGHVDPMSGTWTLTAAELVGLSILPPPDFSGSIALTIGAVAAEQLGGSAVTLKPVTITIAPVTDTPVLALPAATGSEDSAIPLTIGVAAGDIDGSETITGLQVSGLPAGASLNHGTALGNGVYALTTADLVGLTLTPPANYAGTLSLTVTATAKDGTAVAASASGSLSVTGQPVADAPLLTVADGSGPSGHDIALNIGAALVDADGSEVLSVTVAGLPAGARLSAGLNNGNGSWTLSSEQLAGLTLTPPAGFSGTLALTVTAIALDGGLQASHSEALTVTVTPVADAPTLSVAASSGVEDQPVALSISAALATPVPGEVLSVTVSGVPSGAVLSAGTNNGDGTWTLTGAQLGGLTLTPPSDFSGSLSLTVTATSSVNGTQASHSETLTVTVAPVADAPGLTVLPASGLEDQAIALSIGAALAAPAAGETLSVVIGGVPSGAVLSAGVNNGNGTWTLTGAQLSGLKLTPPHDFSGSIGLTVTATSSVNGTQASHSETLAVTVAPVADAPTLSVASASGSEDQAIALSISSALVSPAAGEALSVTVSGVPSGAVLSAGVNNGNGTWTLTAAQLSGLKLTPPHDFSGSIALTVTATSSVNGTQASHSEALAVTVTVAAVADAPNLTVLPASGLEDQAIALSIGAALAAPAAGETLSVVIGGVPSGAVLSAGTNNGNGTWTLTGAQLSGLTITPPHDFSGSIALTVTATSSVNGTQASHSEALMVTVAAVADSPNLTMLPASGLEDQAIALSIGAALAAPAAGETLSVVIGGVPSGAVLSAGTNNGNGTWTLTGAQLSGLTITPPHDFSGSIALTVTATSLVNGTQASHSEALAVTVVPVADAPSLSVASASGSEDQAIALSISSALVSPAAGEVLSVVIAGVPAGAVLSAGVNSGNGTWTLTAAQLSGLTITPPHDFSGSIGLTVTATSSVNGTQASHSEALTVSVAAVADAPSLTVVAASGLEDQGIALSIGAALAAPSAGETLSVVIGGVPSGAVLSAGVNNGNGTWTLTGAQLSGLKLTPPHDFSGSIGLTVTATSSVNGTQASHSEALSVTVAAVADAPSLTVLPASGLEDQPIALSIGAALTVPAAGEALSVTVSGVPSGAVLSAGVNNGNGTWTLTGAQLSGLTITPPHDFSGSIGLTVTATSSVNGTQASHSEALSVTVAPVADAPSLAVLPAYGREDLAIGLNIAAHLKDIDGSESLSVIVSGMPAGAVLSAGVNNGNGSWTLTGAQLSGLTITPPHDFSGTIGLTVTARATESGGGAAATVLSLPVSVAGVADTPTLSVSAASGVVDTPIGLNIAAALQDTDLSESLSVRIAGVPAGARLSHGLLTSSAGGFTVWTLAAGDLAGLTITPPCHYTGVMDLTVRAVATESDGDSALSAASHLMVTVTSSGAASASAGVNLNLGVVAGVEDTPVTLNLLGSLTGLLGSATLDSVVVTGVGNATLSAGVKLSDGSYLLTPAQLLGLKLIPPLDVSGDYTLGATVNLGGSQLGTSVSATLGVHVVGAADAPTLSVSAAAGAYASAIPLSITGALTDTSGTEHLHYILNLATGAHLSAGINNGDGTWTVLPSQLAGLTVTPPYGFSGSLPITVTAVSQEAGGAVASTSKVLGVTVAAPSAALLSALAGLVPLNGVEDVALDLGGTLLALNLGSIASLSISGIPAGATLSSGGLLNISAGNISASLLGGLKLNMPANYSGDFQISATVKLVGGLITLNKDINIHVAPVVDLPTLTVGATINGTEDQAVGLNIAGGLVDLDGSEALSFTVAGLPAGVRLSAGHVNPTSGAWTLTAAELVGLKLLPPPDYSGTITLSIGAVATELLGGAGVTLKPLTITIAPVTDTPVLALPTAVGSEDSAIPLTIGVAAGDIDGSETITGLVVSGLPAGATLNHGTPLGNGSYSLTTADLIGLTITPPANYAGTLALTVTATAKDGAAAAASASGSLSVTVKPVADAPTLTVANCTGQQGHDIALNIGASLVDTDASEVLSVVVAGLPAGAVLSAGLNNGDGTWTLTGAQLAGLKLHTAAGFSGDVNLTVTAHALDGGIGPCNQSLADSTATMTVHVQPEIAAPHLALPDVTLVENTSVLLDLGVGLHGLNILADLSVTVAGLPVGAGLSAGTHNQDGSWTIQAAQLAGLRLTPPLDSTADFTLTVTASAHAAGLAAVETSGSLHVTVLPDLGDSSLLHAGFAIAPSLGLSVLGTQIVAGATITLDSGLHSGDCLTLGGLHTETDASGHLLIAGTGIQVTGGGYDAQHHTLTLSGNASASVYESVLRSIHLDPSNDGGSRSIAIDLLDGNGHAIALGHQAITLDVGLDGSATGTVLGGVLGLVDGALGGLAGAGLGLDLGSLGDALAGHTDGGATSSPVDDHLHNATNYLHA